MKLKTIAMSRFWIISGCVLIGLVAIAASTHAVSAGNTGNASVRCLSDGQGYFRARISGSINSELNWPNNGTECTGATRPDGGVRMRFSHAFGDAGQRLVFLLGIPALREGQPARNISVNLTVIREGAGQFYGTTGDDKCSIDAVKQEAIVGVPHRNRSYRVTARGFCMQPAPSIRGKGAVLLTRFDFSGPIDFSEEDNAPDAPLMPVLK
jgi:hypothetical protein